MGQLIPHAERAELSCVRPSGYFMGEVSSGCVDLVMRACGGLVVGTCQVITRCVFRRKGAARFVLFCVR